MYLLKGLSHYLRHSCSVLGISWYIMLYPSLPVKKRILALHDLQWWCILSWLLLSTHPMNLNELGSPSIGSPGAIQCVLAQSRNALLEHHPAVTRHLYKASMTPSCYLIYLSTSIYIYIYVYICIYVCISYIYIYIYIIYVYIYISYNRCL